MVMGMKECINPNCPNNKKIVNGDYCPECGQKGEELSFGKSGKLLKLKKDIKKGKRPQMSPDEINQFYKVETKEEKAQRKREKYLLFTENMDDKDLRHKIYGDMDNLAMQEAGTKWMKAGAMLSFNSRDQMIAAGLKAIIDQNKLMIRQNELLLREIKKINNGA